MFKYSGDNAADVPVAIVHFAANETVVDSETQETVSAVDYALKLAQQVTQHSETMIPVNWRIEFPTQAND